MGITDPAEQHFEKGLWGFDGSVWRKLNMLWGITSRWHEVVTEDTADAGTNDLFTTAVPTGEVWVLQAADCYNTNKIVTRNIAAHNGSTLVMLVVDALAAAASVTITGYCHIPLEAGDKIRARFLNCDANDDLALRVWGYKMDVA